MPGEEAIFELLTTAQKEAALEQLQESLEHRRDLSERVGLSNRSQESAKKTFDMRSIIENGDPDSFIHFAAQTVVGKLGRAEHGDASNALEEYIRKILEEIGPEKLNNAFKDYPLDSNNFQTEIKKLMKEAVERIEQERGQSEHEITTTTVASEVERPPVERPQPTRLTQEQVNKYAMKAINDAIGVGKEGEIRGKRDGIFESAKGYTTVPDELKKLYEKTLKNPATAQTPINQEIRKLLKTRLPEILQQQQFAFQPEYRNSIISKIAENGIFGSSARTESTETSRPAPNPQEEVVPEEGRPSLPAARAADAATMPMSRNDARKVTEYKYSGETSLGYMKELFTKAAKGADTPEGFIENVKRIMYGIPASPEKQKIAKLLFARDGNSTIVLEAAAAQLDIARNGAEASPESQNLVGQVSLATNQATHRRDLPPEPSSAIPGVGPQRGGIQVG
ncbi:MAG: hypothetical protein AAF195_00780 [Pseudomonadota bacterium]